MIQSVRVRLVGFVMVTILAIGGLIVLVKPFAQPLAYHNFADQRPMVGIPHALNVLSNAPFIVVGALGIAFLLSARSRRSGIFVEKDERWPYWVYFVGLVLTGIGSAYYHANPVNGTLTWDRAALAITFMGLFTAILAERVHVGFARWALAPLVVLGAASVFYWDWTERVGAGDLRFYFSVQFFPLLLLPLLLVFCPPRYSHSGNLLASLMCYVLAKGLEKLDAQVYTDTGFVSGHTLKHLVAGLSAGFILLMLWQRHPRTLPAETAAARLATNRNEMTPMVPASKIAPCKTSDSRVSNSLALHVE